MKSVIAILLYLAPITVLAQSGFLGRWKVESVTVVDQSSEWSQEKELPRSIEIKLEDNKIVALFTDKGGATIYCHTFNEIIEGNEAILFGCPVPYKSNEKFSPIHRMQLKGKVLETSTVTDKLVYTWKASKSRK